MKHEGVRRIGLVLSGGGAKGGYTLGCLKALRSEGVRFDAFAGTSSGALNALIASSRSSEGLSAGEDLWLQVEEDQFSGPILSALARLGLPLRVLGLAWAVLSGLAAALLGLRLKGTPLAIMDHVAIAIYIFAPSAIILVLSGGALWPLALLIAVAIGMTINRARMNSEDPIYAATFAYAFLCFSLPFGSFLYLGAAAGIVISILMFLVFLAAIFVRRRLVAMIEANSLLSTDNLREYISEFLCAHPPRLPTFVTVADLRSVFDPDYPTWDIDEAPDFGEQARLYRPAFVQTFIPSYISVTAENPDETVKAVVASTSLPFGIFAPTVGGMSVDGALADNFPTLPLMELDLDDILIVSLERKQIDKVTELPISSLKRLAVLERLTRVAEFRPDRRPSDDPAYPVRFPNHKKSYPPEFLPLKRFHRPPRITLYNPPRKVGGLFDLLRFQQHFIRAQIDQGEQDMREWLKSDQGDSFINEA